MRMDAACLRNAWALYRENMNKDSEGAAKEVLQRLFLFMDFSLLSPLEFFVVPKNGDGRNNEPPAMRVRVDCYTKKLPFRVQ